MSLFATESSPHDAGRLILEWRRLAKKLRLEETVLHRTAAGLPVLGLRSRVPGPGVYLSAGVHGDEAAPPWALLAWAWHHADFLQQQPVSLCPCLNPDGLLANTRVDERGRDLNRSFHQTRLPLMKAWHSWVRAQPLRLGLCLHEDYDARGCYLYALGTGKTGVGEKIMRRVEELMVRDERRVIDGHRAKLGILQRESHPQGVVGPEALVLREPLGCPVTLTFETPSEFDLDERLAAHQEFLSAALEYLPPA